MGKAPAKKREAELWRVGFSWYAEPFKNTQPKMLPRVILTTKN